MKQTLTLFLFFFSISLSAQILTNSTKVRGFDYAITFNEGVYPKKKVVEFPDMKGLFSIDNNTFCDSTGQILFMFNGKEFYTRDGEKMASSPSLLKTVDQFTRQLGLKTVCLGNNLYRCYFFDSLTIYSLTIDMNLNGGKGDLTDSIPNVHFKDSFEIVSMSAYQTDSLFHRLLVVFSKEPYGSKIDSIGILVFDNMQPSNPVNKMVKVKVPPIVYRTALWVDVLSVSNNKTLAIVATSHLFDISGNIPVFIKSLFRAPLQSNTHGSSGFSPNDSIVYTLLRSDSAVSMLQTNVYEPIQSSDHHLFEFSGYFVRENISALLAPSCCLLPNRKMIFYFPYYTNYPMSSEVLLASINRPDVFGSGCAINFKEKQYKSLLESYPPTEISSPIPFTQFGLKSVGAECGASVIPNLSDPLFKKLVWYSPTGDSSVSTDGEPGKIKFNNNGPNVLILKGITQTGYTAWFTDTVETSCFVKANFYSTDSFGCQWIAQTFIDSSCLNTYLYDPGTKWIWDFGDGDIVQSDTPVVSHVFTKSGYFKVKMTIQNMECIDSITKEKAVFIRPAPKPGFTLSSTNWCKSFPITLKDEIGSGFMQKIYVWGDGDSIVVTDSITLFHHTYTQLGSYTIKQYLYSVSGCINKLEQVVHIYPSYRLVDALPAPTVTIVNNFNTALRFQSVADPKGYQLYRSDIGWFETIKDTSFIDYTTTVSEHKYTYAVRVLDYCNNVSLTSEKENSILLTGSQRKHYDVVLSANRSLISNEPHQLMTETSSGEFVELVPDFKNTYTDTKFYNDSMWDRTYFIQYCSKADTSCEQMYSNKIVFTYVPDVFIPTIISKSQTPFFVPQATLMSSGGIVIYDIMGRKVYESNNLTDPIYIDHFGQGYHVYTVNGKSRDRKDYSDRGKILVVE